MSEYQYYEFRAIDKPLSKPAMAALRQITSRAEITSTSLINEYHFGDFKGDPDKLMKKYFDAFLYFANWGTHRLMIRLPRECLDAKAVKPYCVADRVQAVNAGEHTVLDFWSPEDCRDDEWHEWQLGDLLPLRADLMAGDLSCLYLAWLSAVEHGDVEDDALEPPVPPGLRKLSGPLTEFAEFLYLDRDLIDLAAKTSAAAPARQAVKDVAAWVAALPETDKNAWLLRIMQGDAPRVSAEIQGLFQGSRKPVRSRDETGKRRTAGMLREADLK